MSKRSRLLLGLSGALTLLASTVAVGVAPAQGAVLGQWKVDCTYVKTTQDDPIVLPGQPGASHAHDFWGNIGVSAYSTYETLAGVTSTCSNKDFSSYWLPSLYRDGKKIKPTGFIAYYENRFAAGEKVEAFPPGFRMVFGNRNATTESQLDDHIVWACSDNTQFGIKQPPASCGTNTIQLRLMWPYCWDGKTPANGSYRVSFAPGGKCPAATPRRLPTLRTNIYYNVSGTSGDYSFSSGSVYSVHGDFFNAWDQPTLEDLVTRCLNAGVNCGHFKGTSPGKAPPTAGPAASPSSAPRPTASATTTPSAPAPAGTSATPSASPGLTSPAPASPAAANTVPATTARARPANEASPRWQPVRLVSADGELTPQIWAAMLAFAAAFIGTGWIVVRRTRRRTDRLAGRAGRRTG